MVVDPFILKFENFDSFFLLNVAFISYKLGDNSNPR